MTFYRRRLPHLSVTEQPVFLTWRLHAVCLNIGRSAEAHCPPGKHLQFWIACWMRLAQVRFSSVSQPLPIRS